MKKLLFIIPCVVFVWAFSLNASNLVQNGGFESWAGDTLAVWNIDSGVNVVKESTYVHSGSYAIDITTTSTSNRGVWQQISISGGAEYIYSVWVRANGTGSNGMGILVTWRSSDGSYMSSSPTKYNSDSLVWENIVDTVIAPDTAAIADLKIRGYMNNGDAGIADDADFEMATGGISDIDKLEKSELSFSYSDGKLTINMSKNSPVSIGIYDMAGNLITKKEVAGSSVIPLELARGVYFAVSRKIGSEIVKKFSVVK